MTWEQKLQALNALGEAQLLMRRPGDWYVHQTGLSLKEHDGNGILTGRYGNGKSPEEAVNDHWTQLVTVLPADGYLVLERGDKRQHLRWNGFMWADVSNTYPTERQK